MVYLRNINWVAGLAGFASVDVGLFNGLELRETLSLGYDEFPRSRGFFNATGVSNRSDLLVRASAELWSPTWLGLRFALSYGYTNRNSSADAFDYTDHRALVHVVWQSSSDELGVHRIGSAGRVPMQYDAADSSPATEPKRELREVLKQDEDMRRGSSCLK